MTTRKEALTGVFRSLEARAGLSEEDLNLLIEIAADKLSSMAGPHLEDTSAAFRDAGLSVSDSEKKKIEYLARELAKQIEAIHKPTVIALAEVGYLRDRLGAIAAELKDLSAAANRAKIDAAKAIGRQGRATKGPIKVIRRIAADLYFKLTGEAPSVSGSFLDLSKRLIEILELDDKPSGFAKLAYNDFQLRRPPAGKNSPN